MKHNKIMKLFKKLGFKLDRIKGSHHIFIKNNKSLSIPIHRSKETSKFLIKDHLKREFNILINV